MIANNRSDDVSLVDIGACEEAARLTVGHALKHIAVGRVPDSILQAIPRQVSVDAKPIRRQAE